MGALLPSIVSGLVAAVEVEKGTEASGIEVSMVSRCFKPFTAKHSPEGLLCGVLLSLCNANSQSCTCCTTGAGAQAFTLQMIFQRHVNEV